mmetsp:Transcript_17811/g.25168  ORF Transcript_17811/g.25168 Transcript_17811/m.25168 type:complete len:650 (-) Transcript_17811:238-2187(-)
MKWSKHAITAFVSTAILSSTCTHILFSRQHSMFCDAFLTPLPKISTGTTKNNKTASQSFMVEGNNDSTNGDPLFGGTVPGMPDKAPKFKGHDEENPTGGEYLRRMKEIAQRGERNLPRPQQMDSFESKSTKSEPSTIAPQVDQLASPSSSSNAMLQIYQMQLQAWQQQMTAFTQFAAANPEAAKNMQIPSPPSPPQLATTTSTGTSDIGGVNNSLMTEGPDAPLQSSSITQNGNNDEANDPYAFIPKPPKEANRDAYEIQNTADVYFAQLKRDSTVRAIARKAGDIETANKPFSDPGVHAIKGILSDELQEARRERRQKGNEQFTTSRDEMLFAYEDTPDIDESVKRSSGVSYRQKMEEMKRNRTKKSGNGDPETLFKISKEDEIPVRNAADFLSDTNSDLSTSPPSSNVPFSIPKPKPISLDPPSSSDMKSDLENSKLESPPTSNPFASFSNSKTPSKTSMTSASTTQSFITVKKQSPLTTSSLTSVEGAMSCVQATIELYKSSTFDNDKEQIDLLTSVRSALMGAVGVINKAIAEKELEIHRGKDKPDGSIDDGDDIGQVDLHMRKVEASVGSTTTATNVYNTQKLEQLYNLITSIKGDEKFGLKDLGFDKITLLKGFLRDVRRILMEELESSSLESSRASNTSKNQ